MMSKVRGFEHVSVDTFTEDLYRMLVDVEPYIHLEPMDIALPIRKTAKSAGYDVISPIDIDLAPYEILLLPTGFKSYMMDDEVLQFYPRGGQGFKFIRLANTVGVGDSDYYNNPKNNGHYWVKIRNESPVFKFKLKAGKAIAQCIFQKYLLADGDDFTGDKRSGGFGSTD